MPKSDTYVAFMDDESQELENHEFEVEAPTEEQAVIEA